MRHFIGWDIGGVHLKAAHLSFGNGRLAGVRPAVRTFEIWRERGRLVEALREIRRELDAEGAAHALTMTAELADCFSTKAEGVLSVLAAAREALGMEPLRLWSIEGSFASPHEAEQAPLAFAASNWLATATVAARFVQDGLLVDVGSTTTDIVPLASGRPSPGARDDTGRLSSGELVYTGVMRSPPAAIAPEVPLRGGWCRLSPEAFAFTADVYLALGHLESGQVTGRTADGGPATEEGALRRLARLVCADLGGVSREEIVGMARFLESAQTAHLERAARQVLSRMDSRGDENSAPAAPRTLVGTGLGRFLTRRLAGQLDLAWKDLSDLLPLTDPQAAPATSVALLLAEEALGARGPDAWRLAT